MNRNLMEYSANSPDGISHLERIQLVKACLLMCLLVSKVLFVIFEVLDLYSDPETINQ